MASEFEEQRCRIRRSAGYSMKGVSCMRPALALATVVALHVVVGLGTSAQAQPLGTFMWQLQPFCNRVIVNVRQDGAVYTLDGFDDQCGSGDQAPLTGLATPNPNGTIAFGLTIVTSGGRPLHLAATIMLPGLGGIWSDSAGNSGPFVFGANAGGNARPVTGLGAGAVNPDQVQLRVHASCQTGQAVRSVNQDGTVVCEPVTGGAGDITAVHAGPGLSGGGATGEVSLAVVLGSDGGMDAAARADHEHVAPGSASVGVGPGALQANTGSQNAALGSGAAQSLTTGSNNTAVGSAALGVVTTGANNTALGQGAGVGLTTGSQVTLVGHAANVSGGALVNATAIGANAFVGQSNAVVLGSIIGVNGASANTRVGIGTTTPGAYLDVTGDGAGQDIFATRIAGGLIGGTFIGRRANGTLAAPTATLAGQQIAFFGGRGHTGVGFIGTATGSMVVSATQDWAVGAGGTALIFETTPNNSTTRIARATIDQNGSVGIGTTAPLDTLHVVGEARVASCVKNAAGGAIAGVCASDARFKHRVTPFGESLEKVAALRPVHFFWRAVDFPDRGFGTQSSYGLIAQEAEAVLPDLVVADAQGYKAVDYSKLPLLAIQAIRELKERNDALERRLAALEALLSSAIPKH
jgi:hypothetical protein